MEQNDYYHILGVESKATSKEIKEAYRKLAFQYHPDRNEGNPQAAETMKAVNEAYAVLSNSKKRQEYDLLKQRFGSSAYGHFRQTYSEQDIFKGSDINRIFEEMTKSFGLRGFDEIFREFYGKGYSSFEYKKPGFTARGFVFTGGGGERHAEPVHSPFVNALGKLSKYLLSKISGITLPENGVDVHDNIRLSPLQARQGEALEYHVPQKNKRIMIKIPAGIKDGQRIRLAGMGAEGKNGGASGDLYLKVHISKPLLQRVKELIAAVRK